MLGDGETMLSCVMTGHWPVRCHAMDCEPPCRVLTRDIATWRGSLFPFPSQWLSVWCCIRMGRLKMQDWKMRHKTYRAEKCKTTWKVGTKKAAGDWKCRTGKCGTRHTGLKNARQVSMESEQTHTA